MMLIYLNDISIHSKLNFAFQQQFIVQIMIKFKAYVYSNTLLSLT